MKKKFTVKGMHCKSCEMIIKDSLEETDGIKSVTASAKDNLVEVEFDEKKIPKDLIISIIEKEGYSVINKTKNLKW